MKLLEEKSTDVKKSFKKFDPCQDSLNLSTSYLILLMSLKSFITRISQAKLGKKENKDQLSFTENDRRDFRRRNDLTKKKWNQMTVQMTMKNL